MLAKLFSRPRFLGADLEDWTFETWAWLMRHRGGMARLRELPTVTPSPEFFPPTETAGAERGAYVFDRVKALMGMADWPCALETYERLEANAQVSEFVMLRNADLPSGTFRIEDGRAIIAYAADLVARPKALIATLAHELSHYLICGIEERVPGGDAVAIELATDLCVAVCGFGVFGANSAFEFEQHGDAFGQGWRSSRSGYLSERSWAFALAVRAALTEEPAPEQWVKPGVAGMMKQAARYLARNPTLLDPLRAIP